MRKVHYSEKNTSHLLINHISFTCLLFYTQRPYHMC